MFQFRRFPTYAYLIQRTLTEGCSAGFPHSEICGVNGYLLLTAAYRSLSRPSSAPDAKAFPLRSLQLDLVGVDFVSFASAQARKLSHSVTPPLPRKNFVLLGFGLVLFKNYAGLRDFSLIVIVTLRTHLCMRFPQLHNFRSLSAAPLCCLAVVFSLHCSVFKVQLPTSLEVRSKRLNFKRFDLISIFAPLKGPPKNFRSLGMVEISGIEPLTSCLQSRRSPS